MSAGVMGRRPKFLEWIELTHNQQGEKFVLYSFGHTYFTRQLLEGVPVQFIADQCGTSVALVSSTNNHLRAIMNPEVLASGRGEDDGMKALRLMGVNLPSF